MQRMVEQQAKAGSSRLTWNSSPSAHGGDYSEMDDNFGEDEI
jgi:hypothetical protein